MNDSPSEPPSAAIAGEAGKFRQGTEFSIGSAPYLNTAPLVHGLGPDVRLMTPSQLAKSLRAGDVDAGLVSVSEVLEHDLYDVLDGIAVGSDGPVYSVFLAHRIPLGDLQEVACDPASLTSVRLLQLLFAERGLKPRLVALPCNGNVHGLRAFLRIGDPAIAFRQSAAANGYSLWDLGAAWKQLTGLPFVFAVWALRRGIEAQPLIHRLKEAKRTGIAALTAIIRDRPEFDLSTRERYLRHHICYDLGVAQKKGVVAFADGLAAHHLTRVFPVRWVGR